jgi:hypothetical protein
MISKSQKLVIMFFIASIIAALVPYLIFCSKLDYMGSEIGKYYYRINIIGRSARSYKWDIGISKYNKISINENEHNRENLEKFRKTVNDAVNEKFKLVMIILYMMLVLIFFAYLQRNNTLYKNEKDKKAIRIIISVLIIFLSFKIIFSFTELNWLYKDINYYYSLILKQ